MCKKTRAMIQHEINEECLEVLDELCNELYSNPLKSIGQLRSCKAWVYENSR